ncbi:MAG: copper resistance protein NlpE N-terminal domain-containing protein [Woeseiaceae bacterium]
MSLRLLIVVLAFLLAAGCSDEPESAAAPAFPVASLPGVYSGVFPCDGCPGIATTLWLLADGTYFFEQRYAAADNREAVTAHNLGRWRITTEPHTIELAGQGPARRFTRLDLDMLAMQTDSDLEHRLTRDPGASDFSSTIRMMGIMRMQGGNTSFEECRTGVIVPVNRGGDFARFWHQYRGVAGPGRPAFVELEGRFLWSDDGALKSMTIARFVTIKENAGC